MTLNEVKSKVFRNSKLDIGISSSWGKRTYTYNRKKITDFHYGIDYVYHKNSKLTSTGVYAIADGKVISVGKDSVSGNYIWIEYPKLNIKVFYCHLKSKPLVKVGSKVNATTLVGYTGTTGSSTGIHLHLGIKYIGSSSWVNPATVKLVVEYFMSNKYLKVKTKTTTDLLNVRSQPNTNGAIIKALKKGTEVKIIKENYKAGWDKIEI